uniref:ABC transporter permease n=1 Tax=Pseudothermotoga hypogea TaxID=57487 RepID=A0A832I5K3_9THEM
MDVLFVKYLSRRILSAVLLIVLVITINFFIIHLAPGDPATIMTGLENPSPQIIEALKRKYGLDKPLVVQYLKYMTNLLRGDLGFSYVYDQPSWKLIGPRIFPTLSITVTASILAFALGTYLAVLASRLRRKFGDLFLSLISYILYAMPSFWLGLILILVFASKLKWFPTSGMFDMRASYEGFRKVLDYLHHLFLPVFTLLLIQLPVFYRVTRASIVQNLREDYVTVLSAVGISNDRLFKKYVMKNSIIPAVTIFGITLGFSITGAALIEIVFAWPGMGRLLLDAVFRRDYQLLLSIYFLMAVFISVAMIVTDIVIAILDPRVRLL